MAFGRPTRRSVFGNRGTPPTKTAARPMPAPMLASRAASQKAFANANGGAKARIGATTGQTRTGTPSTKTAARPMPAPMIAPRSASQQAFANANGGAKARTEATRTNRTGTPDMRVGRSVAGNTAPPMSKTPVYKAFSKGGAASKKKASKKK